MKKFFAFAISMVCIIMAVGCGEKKMTSEEIMNVNGALVIGFSIPYSGTYTTTKVSPPLTISGVEFTSYEGGGGIRYSPKSVVNNDTYQSIVNQLIALYGQPSRTSGDRYQWVTQNGDFKLTIAYNTNIYHNMAIGIDTK